MVELLIVVALLVLLATALLVSLNPWSQINKGQDSKRKSELTQLNKVFEDYYNDKNCYPKPINVCYPGTDNGNPVDKNPCYICGSQLNSPVLPYLSSLPCDPKQPTKKYLYQVNNETCPSWYRIYSELSYSSDPIISQIGCSSGCGPGGSYNYGVSSPNIDLESTQLIPTNTPSPTPTTDYVGNCSSFSTLFANPNCNACGDYASCKATNPGETYYTDVSTCVIACFSD